MSFPMEKQTQGLPDELLKNTDQLKLPDLLLGYQKTTNAAMLTSKVVFVEKSRRIGITWGVAADAVLTAAADRKAGGMDVFYIGFNLDMTREFIDTCASWAKAFNMAAASVHEFLFNDDDEREIKAFRITFNSGFEIVALTSRPRSLRGRQGYVIIDEAAFHDDLKELMKAALALLIWGGKVLVISTHDGVDNPFNQYIQDARAGRNNYKVIRIDLDDALKDGLYKRICLKARQEWTQDAQDAWRDDLISLYGDGAEEELFCVPRRSAGAALPGTLVESRMTDAPLIRLRCDDEFVYLPAHTREQQMLKWCDENLRPLIAVMNPKLQSFMGEDFARSGDLTVLFPLQLQEDTRRHVPFAVEMSNVPFQQQRQVVWYILDSLPRFTHAAFDARGNGSQLAEETMQRYGQGRISTVMISTKWYLEAMPKYKAALEDATIDLPRHADILADHRAAVMVGGVIQVPDKRATGTDGNKRHGDSLIAAAMAYWATLQPIIEYAYDSVNKPKRTGELRQEDDDDGVIQHSRIFGNNKGAF